jgi:hypothetical protein
MSSAEAVEAGLTTAKVVHLRLGMEMGWVRVGSTENPTCKKL